MKHEPDPRIRLDDRGQGVGYTLTPKPPTPLPGGDATCQHCGKCITLVNYSLGARWMHQPSGAAFHDGMYEYCHRSVAVPVTQ